MTILSITWQGPSGLGRVFDNAAGQNVDHFGTVFHLLSVIRSVIFSVIAIAVKHSAKVARR